MLKNKQVPIYYFYAFACLISTGLFVFEVPKIVFWAPYILFIVFFAYNRYKKETFRIPASAVVLAVFAVVYVIFSYYPKQSFHYQAYIHIQAVLMYLIGYNYFQPKAPMREKLAALDRYLLAISVMYVIYIAVTFIHYYWFTPADLEERFYYSIWYNYVKKPATVISMSLVIPLTYGTYSLFFSPWYKKLIGVLFIAITAGVNLFTATRTLVYLIPVLLIAEFFVWIIFVKKKVKLGLTVSSVLGAVLLTMLIVYYLNKDTFLKLFEGTVLARFMEYGMSTNGRWSYSKNVLEHFSFTYLGSGAYSASLGTPHNIWLYIYDYGGIVSFLVYCVFTGMLIVNFIRFLCNKKVLIEIKILISTVFSVIFIEYMLEPFILPLPSFYILTLFIFGLFSGLSKFQPKEETAL